LGFGVSRVSSRVSAILIAFAAVLFSAAPASANLDYILNTKDSGSALGSGPYGTVKLQQVGSCTNTTLCEVQVTVTLTSGAGAAFVATGGPHVTFAFNLSSDPTLMSGCTANDCINFVSSNFAFDKVNTAPPGNFGTFDYGISSTGGTGGNNQQPGPLVFDVYATGLTPAKFIATSPGGFFFAADILFNGQTGEVASNELPEPTTLLIFGAGLAGAAIFRRRKRQSEQL